MKHAYFIVLAACMGLVLAAASAPVAAQPGCDLYDSGLPRPVGDPNPDIACGGPGNPVTSVNVLGTGSLTTLFAGNNSFAGNTFDVTATVDLTIDSFAVNLGPGTATTITIYWRPGTSVGFEGSAAGWTSLGSDTVAPAGADVPTPVNIGGLALVAGNTYGFYVDVESYPSASLQYTNGGPTVYSNADLSLTTQFGKGNPAFTGADFFPRQWNGTIFYTLGGGVGDADLDLTKTASSSSVVPGGALSYTLGLINNGPEPGADIVVTDTLPAEYTWTSDTCGAGPPAGGPPGGVLTWNVGALAAGSSVSCTINGVVNGSVGTNVVNTATATSSTSDPTPPTATVTVGIFEAVQLNSLSTLGLLILGLLVLLVGGRYALRGRSS